MAVPNHHARKIMQRLMGKMRPEELAEHYGPQDPKTHSLPPRIPGSGDHGKAAVDRRRSTLRDQGIDLLQLVGEGDEISPDELAGNIENLIGFARMPVGVIGPLRIRGTSASGDFYVPLATTEGALVASCQRGSQVISRAGGASACCFTESVSRAPCFVFDRLIDTAQFLAWVIPQYDRLQEVVAGTSQYCQLLDLRTTVIGKEVYLGFEFTTGDAAGQNMVTIATEALCLSILADAPMQPTRWYLDGNLSGDKKATMLGFTYARGKKVVADVTIDRKIIRRFLRTEPEEMFRYWQISVLGGVQSGAIGVQGHFANALAALFIACGQDAACVSEAAVGITRMDITKDGGLYVAVSLPNLIVGTVGGGTRLPTQRECLEMMDCYGSGKARKLSEICAATVLAGEISIIGAMAAGHFGHAHATYGRQKPSEGVTKS
jgi:hydroxymethylglutaryl-CoA reductase (NADPH)